MHFCRVYTLQRRDEKFRLRSFYNNDEALLLGEFAEIIDKGRYE